MSCAHLSKNQTPDCPLPVGGTEPLIYAVETQNILELTIESDGSASNLTLVPGAYVYKINGFKNDMKKKDDVVNPGIGVNGFTHDCGLVIYSRLQEDKNEVGALVRGTHTLFMFNRGKDDAACEVYGPKLGLEVVPGTIRDAHANGGFFVLELKTPEGGQENDLPPTFGGTYAGAVAILEGLLSPP